jgi:hypothetical protein
MIAGSVGLILMIILISQYGPKKPSATVPEAFVELFQPTPLQTLTPAAHQITKPTQTLSPMISTSSPVPSQTPTFTPTPEWMVYDEIDFRNQPIEALLTMGCNDDQVYLHPFNVVPYSPELVNSGIFYSDLNFSIAWDHLGFYGLWIHSGRTNTFEDLPAYPLQLYLENDVRGFRRDPNAFQKHLQSCLIGGELRLRQGEVISINKTVAAVRIPPTAVREVSRHPMDLVPFLAENYPESGFDKMQAPGLLFYFCGRQLTGEAFNSELDYWTQSRIIVGFQPVRSESLIPTGQ